MLSTSVRIENKIKFEIINNSTGTYGLLNQINIFNNYFHEKVGTEANYDTSFGLHFKCIHTKSTTQVTHLFRIPYWH